MSQNNLRNILFAMSEFISCLTLNEKKHEDNKLTSTDIINLNQKYENLQKEYLLVKEIIKEEDKSLFTELEQRYKKLKQDLLNQTSF